MFLASLAMLIMGFFTGQTVLFLAVAALMGGVAFGRFVGMIADGYHKAVIPPLVVELVIVGILIAAHTKLGGA